MFFSIIVFTCFWLPQLHWDLPHKDWKERGYFTTSLQNSKNPNSKHGSFVFHRVESTLPSLWLPDIFGSAQRQLFSGLGLRNAREGPCDLCSVGVFQSWRLVGFRLKKTVFRRFSKSHHVYFLHVFLLLRTSSMSLSTSSSCCFAQQVLSEIL